MSGVLRVVQSGVFTTVQDLGRQGMQRYGVPMGGAMDRFALVAANRLVGNEPDAATLEITAGGATFEFLRPVLFALTGVDMDAHLSGRPVHPWETIQALRGTQLTLGSRKTRWGARAYLALGGGIDVPPVLGSRSTYLPGGFGGLDGRKLQAGDVLTTVDEELSDLRGVTHDNTFYLGRHWPTDARPPYRYQPTLRVLPGPHSTLFTDATLAALTATTFRVSVDSNRMGYRLEGAEITYQQATSIPSLGMLPGVVQVPPGGMPILLTADAQTTGGYPLIAVVIAPDLPLAGQLLPGDPLRFHFIGMEAALAARRECDSWLRIRLESDDLDDQAGWSGAPDAWMG